MESFRAELRGWLEAHAPQSLRHTATTPFQGFWGGRTTQFDNDAQRVWFEACLERGYTAPKWAKRYGGAAMDREDHRIWIEELTRLGLPMPLVGFGLTMIGPILLSVGTEAQRARHLPAIARGEIRWCQGYSEPNAGSDLAALGCRGVIEGDELVVNGQKIWTSHAERSDWIFCLVRTNLDVKKQAGITFVLADMRTPGITTRPIELISGASPFCEVFLEDVRVPLSHIVGELDKGWGVAKALLAHEREMVGESVAAGGARPDELIAYDIRAHALQAYGADDQGRLDAPLIRDELTRLEMDIEAMRLTIRRVNERLKAGANPGPESSIFKIAGTELNQARWDLANRIAGVDGLGWEGAPYSDRDRALGRQWLRSRGNTIEGGTSEIQRNIIARRVLGLPKG